MIKKVFVCHDKSQRGSVCWLLATEMRQIGAIGLVGYYGFTTIEETKNQKCEIMVREMKKGIFWTFVLFR